MNIFLARQPIFDKKENVHGYEVLYRSSLVNVFDGREADRATSEVIINTFQVIGIDNLSNGKPVFINFTETLIKEEVATLIPHDLLVVELLEDVTPCKKVLEKCKVLKERGYRIALDDFRYLPGYGPLLELADIVKIDFFRSDRDEIEEILGRMKGSPVECLAEKVETRDDFEYAKGLGFKYFQGYFFSKPEVLSSRRVEPIKANHIQLIDLVSGKEELDFEKIDQVITQDLSLTYNLLKLVNSVAFGPRYRIEKTKRALVFLGEKGIKKWIYLMVLTELGQDRPDELTRLSLIRARFLELLAAGTALAGQSEDLFLIGLFSLLDVILNRDLGSILSEIKASEIVTEALVNGGGEPGQFYQMALAYEKGEWERSLSLARNLGVANQLLVSSHASALRWYTMLMMPQQLAN